MMFVSENPLTVHGEIAIASTIIPTAASDQIIIIAGYVKQDKVFSIV
jgi:hypothetical protein